MTNSAAGGYKITGSSGNDTLTGGSGNDTFVIAGTGQGNGDTVDAIINSGEYIIPYITNKYEGYDINTRKDWVFAKYLINQENYLLPKIHIKSYSNV